MHQGYPRLCGALPVNPSYPLCWNSHIISTMHLAKMPMLDNFPGLGLAPLELFEIPSMGLNITFAWLYAFTAFSALFKCLVDLHLHSIFTLQCRFALLLGYRFVITWTIALDSNHSLVVGPLHSLCHVTLLIV